MRTIGFPTLTAVFGLRVDFHGKVEGQRPIQIQASVGDPLPRHSEGELLPSPQRTLPAPRSFSALPALTYRLAPSMGGVELRAAPARIGALVDVFV